MQPHAVDAQPGQAGGQRSAFSWGGKQASKQMFVAQKRIGFVPAGHQPPVLGMDESVLAGRAIQQVGDVGHVRRRVVRDDEGKERFLGRGGGGEGQGGEQGEEEQSEGWSKEHGGFEVERAGGGQMGWTVKSPRVISGKQGGDDWGVRWTSFVTRQAEKRGWSWAWWQFDGDFVLYDVRQDHWVEPIRKAAVP